MFWLAWQIARVRQLGEADRSHLDVSFLQGVALQFVNIKAWMLALALAAGWVTRSGGAPAANPGERLMIVLAVMAVYAFVSNLTYALVGASLRGWLAQGRRLLWFNRTMAAVLVATALWMLRQ
jgi:threonine/homoserine/homoserine lactone efflux protein